MPKLAQVFEHGTLAVGEQGFTSTQFSALVRYNDRHGCSLFKVGHNRLHFGSFVGVIQVGQLAIEILPKPEKDATTDKRKWQDALLQMLRQSGFLDVETALDADLRLRQSPLVDVYLHAFLNEIEHLVHTGLVKRYRITEGNLYKFKGRILFPQQLRWNTHHQERIYTAHQTYDRDNTFNRILKRALIIIEHLALRPFLVSRSAAALLLFEDVADGRITSDTFDRLKFDHNTERYRKAIQLARLIIFNYSPDLCGGQEHVIAILFDMNKVFERFILAQLRGAESSFASHRLCITGQSSKRFWSNRHIRPDIVADFTLGTGRTKVILDTKWKVPKDDQPSVEDLRQMYTYNLHMGGCRSVLVYPRIDARQMETDEPYAHSVSLANEHSHSCAAYYVNLFDAENNMRKDIGLELIQKVILNGAKSL